ncbi:hypothetical protein, partial [Vibrio fluvialis]
VNIDGNIRESNNEKDKINSMYYGNKYKIEGYNEVVKLMEIIESRDISLFKDKGIDWRYMSKFESRIKNVFTDIETPNLLIYDEHKGVASVEEIDEKFLASVDYMLKGLFFIKSQMEGLRLEAEKENLKEKIEIYDKEIEALTSSRWEESLKQVDIMANSFFAQCRDSSILSHAMVLYLQEQKQSNYPAIRTPNVHTMVDIKF